MDNIVAKYKHRGTEVQSMDNNVLIIKKKWHGGIACNSKETQRIVAEWLCASADHEVILSAVNFATILCSFVPLC